MKFIDSQGSPKYKRLEVTTAMRRERVVVLSAI